MSLIMLQGDARRRAILAAGVSTLVACPADHAQSLVLLPLPMETGPIEVVNLAGAATGQGAAAGAVTIVLPEELSVAGTGTGQGAATGSLSAELDVAGVGLGQGTATGAADRTAVLSGAGQAQTAGVGIVTIDEPGVVSLTGVGAAQGGASGTISTSLDLSGAASGQGLGAGAGAFNLILAGSANAVAVADGLVVTVADLVGQASGAGQGAGLLSASMSLSGAASGAALAAGAVSTIASLSGTGAASAAGAGTASLSFGLQGGASGVATAAGTISTSLNLSADASGNALGNGAIAVSLSAIGASAASGSGAATLSASLALTGGSSAAGSGAGVVTIGATTVMPSYVGIAPLVNGTGAITPTFAASGRAFGDLMLLFVESANQAVTTPSGWTLLTSTPQSTGTAAAAGGVRLTVFYKISAGTETTVSIADSGDHTTACGLVIRGVDATAVSNLLRNSSDLTNTTYWHAFPDTTAQIATGNLLTITGVTSQPDKGIYTDSFTTLTSGATYTLLFEGKASSGTQVFGANLYATAGGADVDNLSADLTATTAWKRYRHKVTMPAAVTYTNMGFCSGTALDNVSVNIRNVMLVPGDVPIDYPYVPTLTGALSSIAALLNQAGQVQAATTSVSFPDMLTYRDNCLVVNAMANDRDAASTANLSSVANAGLVNVTNRLDQTVTDGQGGGIAVITGEKTTAGQTGSTTATNAASVTNASVTLVLAPTPV